MIHYFSIVSLALDSLWSNKLRTFLTVSIIAVGITSIIGIETSLDVLSGQIATSFSPNGVSPFTVLSSGKPEDKPIERAEANNFAALFDKGTVSIKIPLSSISSASYRGISTDPIINLFAADENWLSLSGCSLSEGRNFTAFEANGSSPLCIIGGGVRKKLFGSESALNQTIIVNGNGYRVVGCLSRQGGVFGGGADQSVVIPIGLANGECQITVLPFEGVSQSETIEDTRLVMRSVRRVPLSADDGFIISSSDALASKIGSLQDKLSLAAFAIGLITIIGAAISLMNVMLVSVKERVKEIGLRKALGETQSSVRRQFLAESLILGQMGGFVGTVTGLLAGKIVAVSLDSAMEIPWMWIIRALLICMVVSLASAIMPAGKAAKLPPVEALRAE